ncbi:MAG: NACHT domain-containing protein [Oscillochloridaceae bacterium umkhey_bin13]
MSTPADDYARLERLRRKLATITDSEDRADQEAAIAALEQRIATQAQLNFAGSQMGDVTTGDAIAGDQQKIEGEAQVGAAIAGNLTGDLTLFTGEASGNYIAEVINLYQQNTVAPQADYATALRRYLKHLYATHATLDLRGIDQRQMDMPLREVYISLTVREVVASEGVLRGGVRAFMEKVRKVVGKEADQPAEREQAVEWTTVLRQPRLAVIGLPGSGKTTLLQYTAVRLCEVLARDDQACLVDLGLAEVTQQHPPVPLLLPLRELGSFLSESRARELAGANATLLLDCLQNYYRDLELPADFFQRICAAGRAIFLLDGLDEVPQTDDRVFVSAIMRSLVTRYPNCRYVLTSRPKAYEGDARLGQGFRECTVDDLSPAQQQRFITNWSHSLHRLLGHDPAAAERPATRFADELWAALQSNQRVRELATNPLLLTIIAIIYYDSRSLPENRAELYEACVTVLLKGGRGKVGQAAKHRETYAGLPGLQMSLRQKRELLAFVAYQMHQRGVEAQGSTGREIHRDDLVAIVAASPALPAGYPPREAAEAFVDELPEHVGLLDEIRPRIFRFSHLSFQEFLAARFVAEHDRWTELLDRYQESWWREVILLCAGHLSQERCWRFLGQLIECGNEPEERAAALALAAAALTELEKFKGQGPLNTRIQAEAVEILERQPAAAVPAAARVQCGAVLAVVGDPRPGVCSLPPPMVKFAEGSFVIGSSHAEAETAGKAYEAYFLKQGDKATAKRARTWSQDEVNRETVLLQPFELARYPVTNAQYAIFMREGGYNATQPWWSEAARLWLHRDDQATEGLSKWQRRERKDQPEFWDDPRFGKARPNHPVVGISWYEATAFCVWLTSFLDDGYTYCLPSEAEWEYAARDRQRRTYPWSNELPDGERANFDNRYDGTSAVGCFPLGATPQGVLDLAGNIWEWTRSEFRDYPYNPNDGRENPAEPAKKRFTQRGGSWALDPILLRAARRNHFPPVNLNLRLGFRLARYLPV